VNTATKFRGVRLMFKVQRSVHDRKWKYSAVTNADRTSKGPSLKRQVNIAPCLNCLHLHNHDSFIGGGGAVLSYVFNYQA